MIVGEVRCLPVSGRAQGGRDRAPSGREHGAGNQDERVSRSGAVNSASSGPIQASRRGVGSDAPSMTALLGRPTLLGTIRAFITAPGSDDDPRPDSGALSSPAGHQHRPPQRRSKIPVPTSASGACQTARVGHRIDAGRGERGGDDAGLRLGSLHRQGAPLASARPLRPSHAAARPGPTQLACWRPCATPGSRSGASSSGTRPPG